MKKYEIKTRAGRKEIARTGAGSPTLIIHGGPGMDYSYLTESLMPLSDDHELIYYEQTPESGTDHPNPTALAQVDELEDVIVDISSADHSIRVVAHSWGTYLALEVARRPAISKISHMALISPMPLTWDRFVAAGGRLVARVDENDLPQVDLLENEGTEESGRALMELVSYAYLAGGRRSPVRPAIGRYNPRVNAAISASIENYSHVEIAKFLDRVKISLIYGDGDYFIPSDTKEIAENSSVTILKECGHFPFSEKPVELLDVLNRSLT